MACALVGLFGARFYYLLVHAPSYLRQRSLQRAVGFRAQAAGASSAHSLTFVPASFAAAAWLRDPGAVLWDHMAVGVLAGGFWVRLGCVFNGCCGAGKPKRG